MKGLMVTLLMFLTTGIVVGQQGSSSKTLPDLGSAGSQNNLLKPLEIGVHADAIRDLRLGKVLFSTIAPVSESGEKLNPNVVSGVTLYPEGKSLNSLSKKTVQGRSNGEGVLRFGLTNADLMALENNQLSMEFGASERGMYRAIEVFYENSTQNNTAPQQTSRPISDNAFSTSAGRTPTPDNSAPSNNFPFGRRNKVTNNTALNSPQPSRSPFIPLPAPHEPGDTDFMGPTLPAAGTWRPPNRTTQKNPALNPERQESFADNQTQGGWRFPDQNDNGFQSVSQQNSRPSAPQDNRQATLDAMKAKWEAEQRQLNYHDEMVRRQNAERLQREDAEREFAQWKWEQELALKRQSETQFSPILSSPTVAPNPRLSADEQLAYNHAIWELERRENLLKSQEDTLNRKRALLDDREYHLDVATVQQNRNNNSGNQPREHFNQGANYNSMRNDGDVSGRHYYPDNESGVERDRGRLRSDFAHNEVDHPDSGFRAPDRNDDISPRVPTSTERGIGKYTAAVAGPRSGIKTNSRDDRVDGFVLFLLLCSLGLNFYLAFISRGFYVRYHELADELRETFSTTH